jgi:hypothetical protein
VGLLRDEHIGLVRTKDTVVVEAETLCDFAMSQAEKLAAEADPKD